MKCVLSGTVAPQPTPGSQDLGLRPLPLHMLISKSTVSAILLICFKHAPVYTLSCSQSSLMSLYLRSLKQPSYFSNPCSQLISSKYVTSAPRPHSLKYLTEGISWGTPVALPTQEEDSLLMVLFHHIPCSTLTALPTTKFVWLPIALGLCTYHSLFLPLAIRQFCSYLKTVTLPGVLFLELFYCYILPLTSLISTFLLHIVVLETTSVISISHKDHDWFCSPVSPRCITQCLAQNQPSMKGKAGDRKDTTGSRCVFGQNSGEDFGDQERKAISRCSLILNCRISYCFKSPSQPYKILRVNKCKENVSKIQ